MDRMNMLAAPFCGLHTANWARVNCTLSNLQVISDAFKFSLTESTAGKKKK